MKHYFIMNPAAGKGTKFHELIDDIHKVCDRRKVSYEIHVTVKIGEATEYVKQVCSETEEPVRFYACGGDGTIKEVASGLVGFEHAELGIIPMGTGTDFIRNFEHPEQLFDIDAQLDGETKKIDLIKFNNGYAINIINLGFDCEVAKQVIYNRRSVFVPKGAAYTLGIAQKITQFDSAIAEGKLYIDGVLYKGHKFQACVFANGSYYGGGYHAAPASLFNDGILDACIIDKLPLTTFLKILGDYKNGTHVSNPKMPKVFSYHKCKEVEFVFARPTDISVDGEIMRIKDKLTLSILHNATTLSLPKACQMIMPTPEAMRGWKRFRR